MKNNSAEYYQELPNGECSIVCFVSRSCAGHEGVGPSYPREEEEEGSEGCTMGTGHIPVHGASAVGPPEDSLEGPSCRWGQT